MLKNQPYFGSVDSGGVGTDTTAPNPYSRPSPVTNFRWDRADGYLKWDKDTSDYMTGGNYTIQYSDNNGTAWAALTTVLQASISGLTGTYQDATGSPGRVYRIKKVSGVSYGTVSSIYVGTDVEYEETTDICYLLIYVKDLGLTVFDNARMVVTMKVASTVKAVNYNNKSIVPVVERSVEVESESGLLIMPVIPTAKLTLIGTSTTIKYDIKIEGRNGFTYTYETKTVPTSESAFVRDLT